MLDREKSKVMIYMFKVICSKDYTSHSNSNSKGIPVPILKKHKRLGHSVFPTTPKTREERKKKIKLNCTSSIAVCETEEKNSRENVICKLISWQIR